MDSSVLISRDSEIGKAIEAEMDNMDRLELELRQSKAKLYSLIPSPTEEEKEYDKAELKAERKRKYATANGLTIHNLRTAGNTVKVVHIRYADVPGIPVAVPVPSFLRGVYEFLPRGGATHITIGNEEKDIYTAVSSQCHSIDGFDYKMGVKLALDQIDQAEATKLLS